MRGERGERGEEFDMTCGNLAAILAHTEGDWGALGGTDHSNIMEIMLMLVPLSHWLPLGEIKTPVKYKPGLHCHCQS